MVFSLILVQYVRARLESSLAQVLLLVACRLDRKRNPATSPAFRAHSSAPLSSRETLDKLKVQSDLATKALKESKG